MNEIDVEALQQRWLELQEDARLAWVLALPEDHCMALWRYQTEQHARRIHVDADARRGVPAIVDVVYLGEEE